MGLDSFVPIGGIVPRLSHRMRWHAAARRLAVPVDPPRRAVDVHGVIEGTGVSESRPALLRRQRNDQRQREGGKNSSRKHDADRGNSKRRASAAAQPERAEQKYERQWKHGGLRQIANAEQRTENGKHDPVAAA